MIDTVKLRSPYLEASAADDIRQQLKRRSAVQIGSGEVLYEVTSDELEGSFDNRIMIRLLTEELVYEPLFRLAAIGPDAATKAHPKAFSMRPCEPYLVVEGSIHKALVGHNITAGPANFRPAAQWFVALIAELLSTPLPDALTWEVEKVDVTECYSLPFAAIQEFIRSMNAAEYPRRKPARYGSESLHFGGTTTAFKLYNKGVEFAKHDGRKLASRLTASQLFDLQQLANGTMRVEVSIKSKKLKADFGEKPLVHQVTDEYLLKVHDREVARVLREGLSDVKTVRQAQEVHRRLHSQYGPQLAVSLYGLWTTLATLGETEARKQMARRTFYRCRKQLVDAGCSWAGTDVVIRHTMIPIGFTLCRSDPRRDAVEDPLITAQLAKYREAA